MKTRGFASPPHGGFAFIDQPSVSVVNQSEVYLTGARKYKGRRKIVILCCGAGGFLALGWGLKTKPLRAPGSGLGADSRALEALLLNDLEPAATQLCPAIAPLRARLESGGAIAAGMSGSGATVFGIHANEQAASAALAALALESPAWALSSRIEVGSVSG